MKKRLLIIVSIILIILLGIKITNNFSHGDDTTSNLLYDVIKNDAENGRHASKYNGEHNDTLDNSGNEDIYFYFGVRYDIIYNNVIFANYCWQILRTTDTGGVKMIYNGIPVNGTCPKNRGDDAAIGKSAFNSASSLAYVGYMYNPDAVKVQKTGDSNNGSLYGKDVIYNNGTYTLQNTQTNRDLTHHYTCNNTTGTCETVRYYFLHYVTGYQIYYIELDGEKNIWDALDKMLWNNNVNSTNSQIKNVVDEWYEMNMLEYNNYLEDVIYCNDRSLSDTTDYNYNNSGWNPNGGNFYHNSPDPNIKAFLHFNNTSYGPGATYYCQNETDRFSISNDKAKLKYPVGLPTIGEGSQDIYYMGKSFWLMSPDYSAAYPLVRYNNNDVTNKGATHNSHGVRPVVSLKPNTVYTGGTGTPDDPYIVDTRTKYKITTNVVGGNITETSDVTEGESKVIEYTPNEGYRLKSITVDNENVDVTQYPNSYTFSNVNNNHTINVVYEQIPVYTIQASATNGTVSIEQVSVLEGTDQTINYDALTGHVLKSLLVDGHSLNIEDYPNSYTFVNVTIDHVLEAIFEKIKYLINVTIENGGDIDSVIAEYGENTTINYKPDEGYRLKQVIIDGVEVDISIYSEEYTFENVTDNHEIKIIYELIPVYSIQASVENGTITESSNVVEGESKTIEYTANEGYRLKSVVVDELEIDISLYPVEYTFENVTDNHEINVIYELIPEDEEEQVIPDDPVVPNEDEKQVIPDKKEESKTRPNTPSTLDRIIVDVELLTISVLVMGICIMLIKKIK